IDISEWVVGPGDRRRRGPSIAARQGGSVGHSARRRIRREGVTLGGKVESARSPALRPGAPIVLEHPGPHRLFPRRPHRKLLEGSLLVGRLGTWTSPAERERPPAGGVIAEILLLVDLVGRVFLVARDPLPADRRLWEQTGLLGPHVPAE